MSSKAVMAGMNPVLMGWVQVDVQYSLWNTLLQVALDMTPVLPPSAIERQGVAAAFEKSVVATYVKSFCRSFKSPYDIPQGLPSVFVSSAGILSAALRKGIPLTSTSSRTAVLKQLRLSKREGGACTRWASEGWFITQYRVERAAAFSQLKGIVT